MMSSLRHSKIEPCEAHRETSPINASCVSAATSSWANFPSAQHKTLYGKPKRPRAGWFRVAEHLIEVSEPNVHWTPSKALWTVDNGLARSVLILDVSRQASARSMLTSSGRDSFHSFHTMKRELGFWQTKHVDFECIWQRPRPCHVCRHGRLYTAFLPNWTAVTREAGQGVS